MDISPYRNRRTWLAMNCLSALVLMGCERRVPYSFKGLDLTGAKFGQSFSMTDIDVGLTQRVFSWLMMHEPHALRSDACHTH